MESVIFSETVQDSLETVQINGFDTMRIKLANPLHKNNSGINFSVTYDVTGNADSSVINLATKNVESGSRVTMNAPDKAVFKNDQWFSAKDGISVKMPFNKESFSETNIFKNILGYRCRKIIGRDLETNKDFEVWICENLPNTIMPGAGSHALKGAMMEIYYPDTGQHFKAISIGSGRKVITI